MQPGYQHIEEGQGQIVVTVLVYRHARQSKVPASPCTSPPLVAAPPSCAIVRSQEYGTNSKALKSCCQNLTHGEPSRDGKRCTHQRSVGGACSVAGWSRSQPVHIAVSTVVAHIALAAELLREIPMQYDSGHIPKHDPSVQVYGGEQIVVGSGGMCGAAHNSTYREAGMDTIGRRV